MAFVVEDGTGVVGANSYTTIAFADDYFATRGNDAWSGTDSEKQIWLVQGSQYADVVFGVRYIGDSTVAATQGLLWPRVFGGYIYVAPDWRAGVPLTLQQAVCEYAVRAKDGPLFPDPVVDANNYMTVVTKEVIGPIETEYKAFGSSSVLRRSYPMADMLMRPLLGPGGTRVIR